MTDNSLKLFTPPYLFHPRKANNLPDPLPNVLTHNQYTSIAVAKIVTAQEDHKYLGKHPEIKAIIKLILRQILANRPKNIPDFVADLVQNEEFTFDVADLVADQASGPGGTPRRSDSSSDKSESFDDLFARIFAGMETRLNRSSIPNTRMSCTFRDPNKRSRSRSIAFQDFLRVSRSQDVQELESPPERRRTSHDRKRDSQDRRSSGQRGSLGERRSSLHRRSSIHDKWFRLSIQEQERRQSICIPAEVERRRATLDSSDGREVTQKESPTDSDDEDDSYTSSSSSDSWSSDLELDLDQDGDWDDNDRALMEGQKMIFAMLGKKVGSNAPMDFDEEVHEDDDSSNSGRSIEQRTQRAVHAAFSPSVDRISDKEENRSNTDTRSLGGVSRIDAQDEVNIEEDEEYFQ